MKNNISKTRLQVQCLIGSVLPTVFGQKKDIQNRKHNCENSDVYFFYSVLLYEQILQVPRCAVCTTSHSPG